ncbi:MAG: DUF3572 domain-containing protein [Chakrabartia godavariana]
MARRETNEEELSTLAIQALIWVLGDDHRAQRFLALTGLDPDDLRARIAGPDMHEAVRQFLEGHQPDLLACADALGVKPELLLPEPKEHWA